MATPDETTQAGKATPPPAGVETPKPDVPASTPKVYTEDDVKSAREEARREAQSQADKEKAKLHHHYQQQQAQQNQRQTRRTEALKSAVDNRVPIDDALKSVDVFEMAEVGRQYVEREQQQQAWNGYVTQVALAASLDPADPRIQGAESAIDLANKVAAAVRADEREAREKERAKAEATEKAKVEAEITSGNLDTIGGAPAGAGGGQDALRRAYQAEAKKVQGNVDKIVALKREYRKKGLDI